MQHFSVDENATFKVDNEIRICTQNPTMSMQHHQHAKFDDLSVTTDYSN